MPIARPRIGKSFNWNQQYCYGSNKKVPERLGGRSETTNSTSLFQRKISIVGAEDLLDHMAIAMEESVLTLPEIVSKSLKSNLRMVDLPADRYI